MKKGFSNLGYGIGLREDHYLSIIEQKPAEIDWFEILTENYLIDGGRPLYFLEKIRQDYPLVMHGVSLSIGSCDPVNMDYLKRVKALANRIDARWISDHLCWTGVEGLNMHDLLPLPYTEEALNHVVNKIKQVQDHLNQQILMENLSSYIAYKDSIIDEVDFYVEVAERADCYLLLDINNVYVSAFNHQFDAKDYLRRIPVDRVKQFHIAGHKDCDNYIIDTHDNDVKDEVWDLYKFSTERFPDVPTLLERDDNIPPLGDMLIELNKAKMIRETQIASKRDFVDA